MPVARVNDPTHEEIFRQIGIDHTVSATGIIFSLLDQQLQGDDIRLATCDNALNAAACEPPSSSPTTPTERGTRRETSDDCARRSDRFVDQRDPSAAALELPQRSPKKSPENQTGAR